MANQEFWMGENELRTDTHAGWRASGASQQLSQTDCNQNMDCRFPLI
jgi:hypothetical protein